jgi:hypothetical protein
LAGGLGRRRLDAEARVSRRPRLEVNAVLIHVFLPNVLEVGHFGMPCPDPPHELADHVLVERHGGGGEIAAFALEEEEIVCAADA